MGKPLDSRDEISMRRVLLVVALIAVVVLLVPVGVQAAANLVVIQDANSTAKAQVDGGKLRVGDGNGPLTVNGSVNVGNLNDGKQPLQRAISYSIPSGFTTNADGFTVPSGKRLVIEYVSVRGRAAGQRFVRVRVQTTVGGDTVLHDLVPLLAGTDTGPADISVAAQDLRLYANPGTTVLIQAERDSTTAAMTVEATVSGYLVDVP